jgi:hypothetical protein
MSFYVILPSNSNILDFPQNTQTNYTTIFRNPIILSEKYEIALCDISYSSQFSAELGCIKFINPFYNDENIFGRKEYLKICIKTLNGISATEFVKNINVQTFEKILITEFELRLDYAFNKQSVNIERLHKLNFEAKTEFHEPIIPVFKSNIKTLINKDNKFVFEFKPVYKIFLEGEHNSSNLMQLLLESKKGIYNDEDHTFTFESIDDLKTTGSQLRILEIPSENIDINDYSIFLMTSLSNSFFNEADQEMKAFLNVEMLAKLVPRFVSLPNKLLIEYFNPKPLVLVGLISAMCGLESESKITKTFMCDFDNTVSVVNQACVYCDIIEQQRIGDVMAPVLQVINLRSNPIADTITYFDNPAYLTVNKSIINTINISLYDMSGNPIHFENKFTFLILKVI